MKQRSLIKIIITSLVAILALLFFFGNAEAASVFKLRQGGTNNTSFTNNSIIFSDGTKLTENNSLLKWNNSTSTLTVGGNYSLTSTTNSAKTYGDSSSVYQSMILPYGFQYSRSGTFLVGETILNDGDGTSTARIDALYTIGSTFIMTISNISGSFNNGDPFEGLTSFALGTVDTDPGTFSGKSEISDTTPTTNSYIHQNRVYTEIEHPLAIKLTTANLQSNGYLNLSRSINSSYSNLIQNTNGGTSAYASLILFGNSSQLGLQTFGAAYTTDGLIVGGIARIYSSTTAGILYENSSSGPHIFTTVGHAAVNERARITSAGMGISGTSSTKITSPTAYLELAAGTSTANTAPLKFNSGGLNATAEVGAIEFLTDKWYATITTGAARKELTLNDVALTSGRVPYTTTNGRLTDSANLSFSGTKLSVGGVDTMVLNGSNVDGQIAINSDTQSIFESDTSSDTNAPAYYTARSRGTHASKTIVQNGDVLSAFSALGYDGTDFALGGYSLFQVDGTPGSDDMPTKWVLAVTPDGSQTPATALTVRQNKNIEIASKVSNYNSISTVQNGMPSIVASAELSNKSAAISATTIYTTTGTGYYRISYNASVTTAASTSSVLGGTNGFQVTYTNGSDATVKTTNPTTVTSSAGNTTGTAISDSIVVYARTGSNIQYSMDYTSVGGTSMIYDLEIIVEKL